jgi:hypothetical protein
MARILLFSRDPGGANVIIPLVRPLRARGHETVLIGKDTALKNYKDSGLKGINIHDRIRVVSQESITELLASERPDLIATATSADDFSERFFWKSAEALGIPSFAILDQWLNYGVRFSAFQVSEIRRYLQNPSHPYLPSKILLMDEKAKAEAVHEGLGADRLVVTGQPHFQCFLRGSESIGANEVQAIRARFGAEPGDRLITFASEPICDTYGGEEAGCAFWGYNERSIFAALMDGIRETAESHAIRVGIVIRPHPKESRGYFENLVANRTEARVFLTIERNIESVKLIKASDLVCGMSSMFLIEAAIMDIPIMSLQIGLKRDNPFFLDRIGVVHSVLDPSGLLVELERLLIQRERPHYALDCARDAVNNIIREMEGSLCRNSR